MTKPVLAVAFLLAITVATPAAVAVGSSLEATCDLNGDGYGEFLWGDIVDVDGVESAGEFEVTYGTSAGLPDAPDIVITRATPGLKGPLVENGFFGATAACGDFDGDGYDDLAVSSPGDVVSGLMNAGSVNVIPGSVSGLDFGPDQLWHQDRPGVKSGASADEGFGFSLATGDFDGDGHDDLAIGVDGEAVNGIPNAGAVNVLYGSPDGLTAGPDDFWHQERAGIKGTAMEGDRFGAVVRAGDFNGDGYDDLVASVPSKDIDGATNAGAINIVYGSADGLTGKSDEYWHQNRKGIKDRAEEAESFGSWVAVGDFDGDGNDDLAVGLPFEDRVAEASGVVHLIPGSSTGLNADADALWHQDRAGIKGKADPFDLFGVAVAAGDFNGDGYDDLAAGAGGEDIGGEVSAGAVHIIPGSAKGLDPGPDQLWHQAKPGVNSAPKAGEGFGSAMVARNYNGDAYMDIVIQVFDACSGYVMYGGAGGLSTVGDECRGPS